MLQGRARRTGWAPTSSAATCSRTIHAARISVEVALVAVGVGLIGGTVIGIIAAYFGGLIDMVLMRFMELLFSFPAILLAVILMASLGTSILNAMIAIGIIFIPGFSRLAGPRPRACCASNTSRRRARSACPTGGSCCARSCPTWSRPCWSKRRSLRLCRAARIGAQLSRPRRAAAGASWGNMLNTGRGFMAQAPWLGIVPGMAMFLCVLGFNLLGDGLRDFFDPHLGTEPGGRGGRMRCPAAPTLQIEALTLEHAGRRGIGRITERVSLEVWPREIVGLIGRSGSGKTMTALAVLGLTPRGMRPAGDIRLSGKSILVCPRRSADRCAATASLSSRRTLCARSTRCCASTSRWASLTSCTGERHGRRRRPRRSTCCAACICARPSGGRANTLTSSPAACSSGDDRDGPGTRPRAADRRRADHRARRHDPGPGARPAARDPRRHGTAILFITHDLAWWPSCATGSTSSTRA